MDQAQSRRPRSPNCPGISLRDALQRARKIYDEKGRTPAERLVIAKLLGYSGLSGASAKLIAALRQYGILEPCGDGMRISDEAMTMFELKRDAPEKIECMKRMAFAPTLFADLRSEYSHLPSETSLRHILLKKGFTSKQADEVSHAYRDNCGLVESRLTACNGAGEDMRDTPVSRPETLGAAVIGEMGHGKSIPDALASVGKNWSAPLLTQTLVISIPRNFVVNVAVQGDEIKKEDLPKIKSQFARWIEGLEEAFE